MHSNSSINKNSRQVALIGMKIHHQLRSTDAYGNLLLIFIYFASEEASRFGRQNAKNKKQASVERSL